MTNAILDAIVVEQNKLQRQLANIARTKAVLEVLGEDVKERNKLERQEAAAKETRSRIKKLNDAAGKLK